MTLLAFLSGEHPTLAAAEAEALLGGGRKKGRLLFIPSHSRAHLGPRLAYTAFGAQVLFSAPRAAFEEALSRYPWKPKGSYAVRAVDAEPHERKPTAHYATLIWRAQKKPRVNLKQPDTIFTLVFTRTNCYACLQLWENNEDFESRKAHKRPGFLPTSMHPKLARACVNLLGARCKRVTDPFCGAGGFLIESGLMGIKSEGWDISQQAIDEAKKNMRHFGIHAKLACADALTLPRTAFVVTDLPYGKSTRLSAPLRELYSSFFRVLDSRLTGTAVIMLEKGVRVRTKLRIRGDYEYYIHKSMTKRILLLSR